MTDALRALAASVVVAGVHDDGLGAGSMHAYPFGGFVLFDRNASTLRALRACTDRLRACYDGVAPILAIDQEGGRVMRVREGVAPMRSAAELGATGDERVARAAGARCAHDLRRAGCNLNFAPVLDLSVDERNTVIGDRSFGADPQRVTRMARAFAQGLEGEGVIATYKHFPGHGATATDSHHALPVIELDEATLRERDLAPFAAIARDAHAMMTAHVLVPALDAAAPATLSRRILQNLLRDELGFRGVCFTDCLQMAAIGESVGSVEGALQALCAGADALTVSHDPRLAMAIAARIAQAADEDAHVLERLQEASQRVHALRELLQPPLPL